MEAERRAAIAVEAQQELKRRAAFYEPYEKQKQFHALGSTKRERCLSAGNQQGKTLAGAAEMAFHLTGNYPDWWEGRRFTHPITGWVGGVTAESTRDGPQTKLLGLKSDGSGILPKSAIIDRALASHGVKDGVDYAVIRHASGGESILKFKHYKQEREKWQGPSVHAVWFDEEPPEEIYSEGLSRTNATGGMAYLTFTPLMGMTRIVYDFWKNPTPDRALVSMGLADALHIPETMRDKIIASYRAHEREARVNGVPSVGSGLIYPIDITKLLVDPIEIKSYWARCYGLDFGWHNTAGAFLAHDRDTDTVYLNAEYKIGERTLEGHAYALQAMGADWMPGVADPAGNQQNQQDGETFLNRARNSGLTLSPANNAVEAGIDEVLVRMHSGRFKVFNNCEQWQQEFHLYARDEKGKVKKENDHLMDATRYAIVSGLKVATTRTYASGQSVYLPEEA